MYKNELLKDIKIGDVVRVVDMGKIYIGRVINISRSALYLRYWDSFIKEPDTKVFDFGINNHFLTSGTIRVTKCK